MKTITLWQKGWQFFSPFAWREITKATFVVQMVLILFSLPWAASMQLYWNKRKRLHKKRVQLPQEWFGTQTSPPFHCFGTLIWPPWRHVKTHNSKNSYQLKRYWSWNLLQSLLTNDHLKLKFSLCCLFVVFIIIIIFCNAPIAIRECVQISVGNPIIGNGPD